MKDRTCYIVGANENYGLDFQPAIGDYVIAVDAGGVLAGETGH